MNKEMAAVSPFKMATIPHHLQFDFVLAKLELILANPLAKVSVILSVAQKRVKTEQLPKASKETLLKETLSIQTNLYEDPKKGVFQEKMATIEVLLNNSKVSNVIGILKLDLANYVNSTGDKLETFVLQKSPEYQGKITLGINCGPAIEGSPEDEGGSNVQGNRNFNTLEPNDSVSQRELSDTGKNHHSTNTKRSITPNIRPMKNPAMEKLTNAVDRMLMKNNKSIDAKPGENVKSEQQPNLLRKSTNTAGTNKLMNLFQPVLNKTNNVINEYSNDEKAKIEKVLMSLSSEKKNAELRLNEQEKKVNDYLKDYEDLKLKFQELEKENYVLKRENENLQISLEREKKINESLSQNTDSSEKFELLKQNEIAIVEKRLEDARKENEQLLAQKHHLENALAHQKKHLEDLKQKNTLANDEITKLKNKNVSSSEDLNKKERQIKILIDEINKTKSEGVAQSFIDNTEKIRIVEEELRKQDIKLNNAEIKLAETTKLYNETKEQLEKITKESQRQSKEIEEYKQKISNLETILQQKNEEIHEMEELKNNYLTTKQNLADIVNLVFDSRNDNLISGLDSIITG